MTTPVNVFGDKKSAAEWVKQQKALWGDGVATLCIIHNATGQQLNVSATDSKYGSFYLTPPPVVENGQLVVFLHVQQNEVTTISEGFVAYKGLIKDTPDYYSNGLLGWMTVPTENRVYCDIFPANYAYPPTPDQIYHDIETNPQSDVKKFGMHVKVTFDEFRIPTYELTRDDVA